MKRNEPIIEDTRFNVENPPKIEGKNHECQPAKLHYIEGGYKTPGIYNDFLSRTAA